ncbi:ABC transporter permease [Brevifollis gellanilyticus]|uniref:ABC transporter permease n=1 Tax=Brevifollis gellanilyticus TaxID=748831 RepID=A0A512MHE8_9BACT|nr:ABC transporter permease subunit [Brevifollis gellanilyticus]GEP45761.1 ABC transporter permease [Brevifollis gellanilyticus]
MNSEVSPTAATPEVWPELNQRAPTLTWRNGLNLPLAAIVALIVHLVVAGEEPAMETQNYSLFLGGLAGIGFLLFVLQFKLSGLRRWLRETGPVLAGGIVFLAVLEGVTTGLRLLPLPYFPSPARVLQSIITDRGMLWNSTWHSLFLLASGYALGVMAGLVSGVCIGWFAPARYWGMPVLKVVGPIPATAWIPLVLVLSPSALFSAISLIALAVWFPVTMLTSSGISNTRASYLDVARTLGAKPSYLIFSVAIPAAMPNIFLGLFMGLGAAFLTLVVAETVGVKSGLGWYLGWAKEWAEYGKVYSALVVMAVFFSTIMTALFKVRDRVLVWQKGTIKW